MKRLALVLVVVTCSLGGGSTALGVSTGVVISQVYGGGGNTGATYTHDYIELFNRGSAPVSLAGWSLQYASATGTGNFGANAQQQVDLPAVSLAPGQYFLVQEASQAAVGVPLPTPDLIDPTPILMGAAAGKVALVNTTTSLGCNGSSTPCPPAALAAIVDLVGYGGANFFEGSGAAPAPSNTTAALRLAGGCTETDNNAADFTIGAPTPRNTSSPTTSCAGDAAPSVASTTPANGATAAPDADVSLTFSEPVTVTGSWYSIACGTSGAHTASVSGGPTTFDLDPDGDFTVGETCTVTVHASGVTDQDASDPPDTMAADHSFSFTVGAVAAIHGIQGAAHRSALTGTAVIGVHGIVTAARSNGFWMQDPNPDADNATSEGIFVFTNAAPTVAVGDLISVLATVAEFRAGGGSSANLTLTQLTAPSIVVESSGNALPAPTVIGAGGRVPPTAVIEDDAVGSVETSGVFDPDTDGIDFYESLEGMRVQVNDARVVGPTQTFGSGAGLNREVAVVGTNASLLTPRGGVILRPGDANPERIILNDIVTGGPDLPAVNVGDSFPGAAVGVVDYSFANFKLELTSLPAVDSGGLARETTIRATAGQLAVATFNVENLDPTDPPAKFAELAGLIVANLRSPDLISVEEVQDDNGATNDSTVTASATWNALIVAIQAAGGPTYQFRQVDPADDQDGGEPGGNIRQGFLFHTDRGLAFVDAPGGGSTTANSVVAGPHLRYSPGRIDPTNTAFTSSRKPLAAEFTFHGQRLFVVGNHFNSKGGDNPLFGRFQPPVLASEVQRLQQAKVVHDFVEEILDADANAKVIVLGDLNDFPWSPPLATLQGSLLTNLYDEVGESERYSYVFDGNSQALDHILVSAKLRGQVRSFDAVHVNAEFAAQASDHDPLVARFCVEERRRACP